jgi:GxxExxY protein
LLTDGERIYADMKSMIYADKKADLIYADLTYQIRGAMFSVYNELGFGHKEQVYQKALVAEFGSLNINYKREVPLKVLYKGEKVGNYRPDFLVGDKVVLEIKAVEFMPKIFETQLLNYLKATDYHLGLLVNFGASKLHIKRLINTYPHKPNQSESVPNPRKSIQISENLSRSSSEERR